jgi:hypothetical protein
MTRADSQNLRENLKFFLFLMMMIFMSSDINIMV